MESVIRLSRRIDLNPSLLEQAASFRAVAIAVPFTITGGIDDYDSQLRAKIVSINTKVQAITGYDIPKIKDLQDVLELPAVVQVDSFGIPGGDYANRGANTNPSGVLLSDTVNLSQSYKYMELVDGNEKTIKHTDGSDVKFLQSYDSVNNKFGIKFRTQNGTDVATDNITDGDYIAKSIIMMYQNVVEIVSNEIATLDLSESKIVAREPDVILYTLSSDVADGDELIPSSEFSKGISKILGVTVFLADGETNDNFEVSSFAVNGSNDAVDNNSGTEILSGWKVQIQFLPNLF